MQQIEHPDEYKISDHARVSYEDGELRLQTREETGRGKRFGSECDVTLDDDAAMELAKFILTSVS